MNTPKDDGTDATADLGSKPPRPAADGVSPPGSGPAIGEVLARRYRLVRFIAEGGMGAVYEAEDQDLGVRVALKTIRSELAEDEGYLTRFKREVLLARSVSHPNVCRIFDVHSHDRPEGRLTFLTMELLGGETLTDRTRKYGPMPEATALPLVKKKWEMNGAEAPSGPPADWQIREERPPLPRRRPPKPPGRRWG